MTKANNKGVEPVFISMPDAADDEASRRMIADNLTENILVEAVPGSGKTFNLIKRLVALVTEGQIPASRIAAITFTRKAAEELRGRFQEEIATLIAEGHPNQALLQKAAIEIEEGYIGTIHGFCGAIIRQYPIEAGIDPTFREIEPEESYGMLIQTWISYLNNHPDLIDLLSACATRARDDKLLSALSAVADHLDVEFPEGPEVPMPDLPPLLDAWDRMYQNALQYRPFADISNPEWSDEERKYWQKLDRKNDSLKRARQSSDVYQAWSTLSFVPKAPGQEDFHSKDAAKELISLINAFYNRFAEFDSQFCAACYRKFARHFHTVAAAAAEERRRLGYLDFGDLLNQTARLLKNNPKIRQAVAARFPRLLVDEFQDTDPIQAEIIFLLTDPQGSSNWRECRPRPGALFVVGDPKQAIYRFRRGDIDTYKTVRHILDQSGGRMLSLQKNWRSQPDICEWVNQAFGNAFMAQEGAGQINFAAMSAHRKPENHANIYRLDFHPSEHEAYLADRFAQGLATLDKKITLNNTNDGNLVNARKMAQLIKEATTTGHPSLCGGKVMSPQDFLVVARTNNVLAEIALEIESRGVPTSLSGGGGLLADSLRQDFLPVYWLLRAVALPSDSALLYAALIGPVFGFNEEDLYRHTRKYERLNVFNDFKNDKDPVCQALIQIRRINNWLRDYPAGTVFRRIVRETGVHAWLQTRSEGDFKCRLLNDVEKMFDGTTFHQGIATLGSWISSWPAENRPAEPGTVSLMTIFRAKGLEAPVVIIAGLVHSEKPKEPYLCVTRDTEPPQGHLRIARKNGEFADTTISRSPEWTGLLNHELNAFTLEEMRKDYVAATRARDCLIICGMSNKDGRAKTPLRKALEDWTNELPVLDIPLPVGKAATAVLSAESRKKSKKTDYKAIYNEFCTGMNAWREKAAAESCLYTSVTELTESDDKSIFAKDSDGGRDHGTALHGMLEAAMQNGFEPGPQLDENLARLAAAIVSENNELSADILLAEAKYAITHEIWQEARSSQECFSEAPVAALEKDVKKLPFKLTGKQPLRLNGTIDLVYRVKNGWKIVDYKTDTVSDDRHLKQLTDYHAGQLKVYSYLWEKLTGEKVVERTLMFVKYNRTANC